MAATIATLAGLPAARAGADKTAVARDYTAPGEIPRADSAGAASLLPIPILPAHPPRPACCLLSISQRVAAFFPRIGFGLPVLQ
jgi:hypothetical protein